jgi:uncharacterized membrane-anchored protein YjiN (DUF445 family)
MGKKPLNIEHQKTLQLQKHKMMATGLFMLMLLIYIACILLLRMQNWLWIGYVKAFTEAGMVGALADWFAVTALFYHPLGIPIPHTNLIENSKKKIGDNLGNFVVENFLNPMAIRPYIQRLHFSDYATQWLSNATNIDVLVRETSWLLKDIIQSADENVVTKLITGKSKQLLNDVKLNEALSGSLQIIMERGDHERLLNFVITKVKEYINSNEELVRRKVKEESHFLIPNFVDNIIAAKLTNGMAKYLNEIEKDPQHKIRSDFNEQLKNFIEEIKHSPQWQEDLKEVKDSLLSSDKISQYSASVWKALRLGIVHDLSVPDSGMKNYIRKTILELVQNLQKDFNLRNKTDKWIRYNAYRYILRNRDEVATLISNTIGTWESKALSNKLELEVGKDLQFIRINGTLVGGLMGLLIYTLTKLLG